MTCISPTADFILAQLIGFGRTKQHQEIRKRRGNKFKTDEIILNFLLSVSRRYLRHNLWANDNMILSDSILSGDIFKKLRVLYVKCFSLQNNLLINPSYPERNKRHERKYKEIFSFYI